MYELRLPASEGDDSGFTNPNSRVGSGRAIGNFSGVNLRNVSDIATDGTTIWVVNSGNAIYTIATNGRATAVTNTTHGLTNITGIAYSGTANTLYAVTSTSSANGTLYTINVNTSGAATRIGAVGGVGVNSTAGLVNSNGSSAPNASNPLYMVGDAGSGSLYTLNTTTGAATKVQFSNFGLSTRETQPTGLAYGGSTLYMMGADPSGTSGPPIYTVNTSTGVATKDGNLSLNATTSSLHFWNDGTNNNLYTFRTTSTPAIFKITLPTTGTVGSRTYTSGIIGTGTGNNPEGQPRSLTTVGTGPSTVHYAVGFGSDRLLKADLSAGTLSNNGLASGFGRSLSDPRALVSNGTNLYLITDTGVHTFNLTAGSADLGKVGSATTISGMAVPRGGGRVSTTTYVTGGATSNNANKGLFTINLGSGAASRVGSATQFDASESNPQGVAHHSGTTYMVGQANASLYSLNTGTGVATRISSIVPDWTNETFTNGKLQATLTFTGSDVTGIEAADFEVRTDSGTATTGWVFDTPSSTATAGTGITIAATAPSNINGLFKLRLKANSLRSGGSATDNDPVSDDDSTAVAIDNRVGVVIVTATWGSVAGGTNLVGSITFRGSAVTNVNPADFVVLDSTGTRLTVLEVNITVSVATAADGGSITVTATPVGARNDNLRLRLLANKVRSGGSVLDNAPAAAVTSVAAPVDTRSGVTIATAAWGTLTGGLTLTGDITFSGAGVTGIEPSDFEVLDDSSPAQIEPNWTIMVSGDTVVSGGSVTVTATPQGGVSGNFKLRLKDSSVRSDSSVVSNAPAAAVTASATVEVDSVPESPNIFQPYPAEIITRLLACRPASGTVGDDPYQFSKSTSHDHLPVSLAPVVPGDDGFPVVKITEGNGTPEPIFGKFVDITRDEEDEIIIIVAIKGDDIIFNRGRNVLAVTAAQIGQSILGSTTNNRDGIVINAPSNNNTRGLIIGGNTENADADTNGFFRVMFNS